MPKTKPGKWSVGLIIAMPLLFIIGSTVGSLIYGNAPASNTILEDVINRPLLSLSMLAGMGCGIAAFLSGLIAVIKQKERAVLVYISTAIGALLIVFLVGEVTFEH